MITEITETTTAEAAFGTDPLNVEGAAAPEPRTATTAAPHRALATTSKTDLVLKQLRSKRGATAASLIEATGWQAHSVRGFLSGTVRKKLGLNLASEVGKDGQRRYRIVREVA